METNTVWVKLPLQCYACFNTCYYRFTLSDELEKGLSVLQVNLLRILNLS